MAVDRTSQLGCFFVEPCLLEGVQRVPYKSLQPLDFGFSLRDSGIVTRPLPYQSP
jgi:hypothetical protein